MPNSNRSSSRRPSSRRSGGLCRPSSMPSCCHKRCNLSQSEGSRSFCSYFSQPMCDKYYSTNPLDVPYNHEHLWSSCQPKKKKPQKLSIPNRSHVEADSVGNTVGMVCSTGTIEAPKPDANQSEKDEADAINFATYLKAFALIYVLPEGDWTAEKIDMLLQEGADLFHQTSENDIEPNSPLLQQPTIYTNAELRVKRTFSLEGHTFTLALEPRFWGDAKKPAELQPKHVIKNLRPVLLSFFRTGSYCLLLTKVGHLLIWKRRRHAYFVLDVKGRRKDDFTSVRESGVAMLVCLQSIDNVVHLASNLSGISPNDEFSIRELVVMRLVTPDGRVFLRDAKHRSIEFHLIDKNYAYLKSNLHLSINPNHPLRNRSALMVGVAAILASKIDHPATWNTNMLDRLICYGVELCRSLWAESWVKSHPIDLDTFPTQLRLGQFVVELKLIPNIRLSDWRCGIRIQGTNFEHHIRASLEEFSNCLFQINNQMYALWVKDSFYYLLDPYRHHVIGSQVDEDKPTDAKWATVRMFRDLSTMLCVFQQLLKESNRQSQFYIHVVRIKNLAECPNGYALQPVPKGHDFEVMSLNERICFQNQEATNCVKSLMEISDYEDQFLDKNASVENLQLLGSSDNEDTGEMEAEDAQAKMVNEGGELGMEEDPGELGPLKIQRSVSFAISLSHSTIMSPSKSKKGSKSKTKNLSSAAKNTKPMKTTIKRGLSRSKKSTHVQISPRKESKEKANGKDHKQKEIKEKETKEKEIQFQAQNTKLVSDTKRLSEPLPRQVLRNFNNKICISKSPTVIKKFKIESKGLTASKCTDCCVSGTTDGSKSKERCWCAGGAEKPIATDFSPISKQTSVVTEDHASSVNDGGGKKLNYPGFTSNPHAMAVVGSESGTVESLNRLLKSAFKVAGRVLTMTPWGNYVVFKHMPNGQINQHVYYVFDGCTCNIDRFRHLDLNCGQAGLLSFPSQSKVVCHMIDSRETKALRMLRTRLDESCRRFQSFLTPNHHQLASEGN